MTDDERTMLFALNDAVQALGKAAASQATATTKIASAVDANTEAFKPFIVKVSSMEVILGGMMAEIAGGDRDRFEEAMARCIGRIEAAPFEVGSISRDYVLTSLDAIRSSAEAFFDAANDPAG